MSTNDAFDLAFSITMRNEGAYSNITGDAGGETYMGISRVFNPSWSGWLVVDDWTAGYINTAARDAALLDEVKEFYRVNYWDRFRGFDVAAVSTAVSTEMFDTAVNLGVRRAVEFLQTALNMQNQYGKTYPDIAVDGKLGQQTLNTLRRYLATEPGSRKDNELILLNCMNGEQYIYYKKNSQHERFRGWFKRV